MGKQHSFKFLDEALNQRLLGLLRGAKIDHAVDADGVIHYSADDEEVVDNELISSVRDEVFPAWKVVTCPRDWRGRYRDYMIRHGVPFREELSNGELWFLIPRKYRPHSWKLGGPARKERQKVT